MTLYGALFTGVSGLGAQGQKIGIISDNIANANTIGYKQAEANFETLVVTQAGSTTYSPGGVRATARYAIDVQGLLSSTAVSTDVAISGSGLFVVNSDDDGSGQALYTRAGSFREDENGNFQNAAGFYLQGWPLSREGLRPGEPGNSNTTPAANIDSLETVNVSSTTGVATATTSVELGINLRAGEDVFPGSGTTIVGDGFSESNFGIAADEIIAPDEFSATPPSFALSTPNGISRGDQFTATTGSGLVYDYEYGGFTIGRQVIASGINNIGDNLIDSSPNVITPGDLTVANGTNVITINAPAHGLVTGDLVRIQDVTFSGPSNIPLDEVNGEQVVTVTGPNSFTYTVPTTAAVNHTNAAGTWTERLFTGNILDANTTTQAFFVDTDLNNYTDISRTFTITTQTLGTTTFSYTQGSPQSSAGQFNNLDNLATAIDFVDGLSARVEEGRLLVGATDASEEVTFANGDVSGTASLRGIDWISELGIADVPPSARRFSTLNGLADIVNSDQGVTAVVADPTGAANVQLRVDDPLDTIQFTDFLSTPLALGPDPLETTAVSAASGPGIVTIQVTHNGHGYVEGNNISLAGLIDVGGVSAAQINAFHSVSNVIDANTFEIEIAVADTALVTVPATNGGLTGEIQQTNQGSLLAEFGIVPSLNGGAYVRGDSGVLGPEYDASGVNGQNIASGDIDSQFSTTTRIFDALGTAHDVRTSFIKINTNEWAVEVYAVDPSEVSTGLVDGQIAVGTISFNGDGSLREVSSSLRETINVNWTNGAEASDITLDLGTAGLPSGTVGATVIGDIDGLTQFDSAEYNDIFVRQNGASVGELVSVSIDDEGFVVASYDNGESQALYQLPIADFANIDGLTPLSGNVYAESRASGDLFLREAGEGGTGEFVSSALEQSNVDLAAQLTDMIVAQRAYQANTRVISTSDELLEQLNQI